jgi:hypothetical protein
VSGARSVSIISENLSKNNMLLSPGEIADHHKIRFILCGMNYSAASRGVSQGTEIMDAASGGEFDP